MGIEGEEPEHIAELGIVNPGYALDEEVGSELSQNVILEDTPKPSESRFTSSIVISIEDTPPRTAKPERPRRERNCSIVSVEQYEIFKSDPADKITCDVPKTGWRRHGGIIFAFASCITVTLASLTAKVLSDFHPFTLGFHRYLAATVFSLPFLIYYQFIKKERIYVGIWPIDWRDRDQRIVILCLILNSIVTCFSFIFRYYAVQYLTVADGTVLSLSGSIFVVFMAHFFLGEKLRLAALVIAIWTFGGVIIIARPPMLTGETEFNGDVLMGTLFGLFAMIAWSLAIIAIRKTRKIHFSVVMTLGSIWGVVQCFGLMFIPENLGKIIPDTTEEILVLSALVILSFVGAICVVFAMKYDNAVSYSLIRSGDIGFSYIWQYAFLSVIPDYYSIIGGVVVFSGIILSTFRKWILTLPVDSKMKRTFHFLK